MRRADDGLRSELHTHLPRIHWQAIESGLTGGGIPDSNFCWRGVEGWVECKATQHWSVTLEPAQVGWHLRRARAGGRTFVAVRRRLRVATKVRPPFDELWLCRGAAAASLRASGLRGATERGEVLGVWTGGPSLWHWAEVEALLLA